MDVDKLLNALDNENNSRLINMDTTQIENMKRDILKELELNDEFMIEDLSWDLYYSKMDSIKNNFKTAMNMLVAEDYIYLKYIKNEI